MKDREQPPTQEEFVNKFKQLFESSTNTDDQYRKWQKVHQNSGGKPGRITKVFGDLEDIKAALPDEAITEYAYKQRFADAMDTRFSGNVEPQIRPTDTMNDIIALAERFDAIMYNTGVYKSTGGCSSSSNEAPKPKNTSTHRNPPLLNPNTKEKPQKSRRHIPRIRSPARLKSTAGRLKEPVSTVAKADTWQMNAQRRK